MLCICLDAFKPEYYKYAPYLNSLRKDNLSGELETILGFTGISVTFFTGFYPDKHGIFAMFNYSPEDPMTAFTFLGRRTTSFLINMGRYIKNERYFFRLYNIPTEFLTHFNGTLRKAIPQKNSAKIDTFFDILEKNKKSFTSVDYPNYFVNRKGSLFFSYSNAKVFKKMREKRVDFCFVHFSELDYISHKFGTRSEETKNCVKEIDEIIEKIGNEKMLIWSDHGMVDVRGEINIEERLRETDLKMGKDYFYFLDTTMARFWFKNERAKTVIEESLKELKNGCILTEKERRFFRVPAEYGDLIFLANPGFIILPNFFQGNERIKAAHGYDPRVPEQKGVYIITGEEGKKNAKMVDMTPTMLNILRLPEFVCDGKSLIKR